MNYVEFWRAYEGRWAGKQRLWFEPGAPEETSDLRAKVEIAEDARHLVIEYDWIADDRPQSGVLTCLLRHSAKAEVKWSDTFHTAAQSMSLKGKVSDKGLISVRGRYAVERDEEWRWRIDVDPASEKTLRIVMYNAGPDGKESLAVEAIVKRQENK